MYRAMPIGRTQFAVLAAIVAVSGFAGGLVSGRLFAVKGAQAQERGATTSINVGVAGLVFRGPNGRMIAKLSSDASGGVFELFNANEQPGAQMRASSSAAGFAELARDPIGVASPNAPPGREVILALDPGF